VCHTWHTPELFVLFTFQPYFSKYGLNWLETYVYQTKESLCHPWHGFSLMTDIVLHLGGYHALKCHCLVQGHSDYSSSESLCAATPPSRVAAAKAQTPVADQQFRTQDYSHQLNHYRVWGYRRFLRATAECFARLSHAWPGRLSVWHTAVSYQNGAS